MKDKIIQIQAVAHKDYDEPLIYGLSDSGRLFILNDQNLWTLIEPKRLEEKDTND